MRPKSIDILFLGDSQETERLASYAVESYPKGD